MEKKFKVGDKVRDIDDGYIGIVIKVLNDGCDIRFEDGDELFLLNKWLEKIDDCTDPKTAFLTELKELMEKYDAKIDIPLLDYDTLGFPDVNVEITLGEAESQINICYPCMKEKSITPSNIFDYDK